MIRERPLLIPFLALAGGMSCADFSGTLVQLSAVVATLCCLVLSCLIRCRLSLSACTFIFFFVWGMYCLTPWKSPETPLDAITHHASRSPAIVEGIVRSRPVDGPNGSRLVLSVDRVVKDGMATTASGNLMLYVTQGDVAVARGDRIRCATTITVPHLLGLPGEFDFSRYLAFQEIGATGRVESANEIVLIRGADKDSLLRRIDLVAQHLGDFIRLSVLQTEVSSVLTALLLGEQKRIPEQLADAYTRAGVNHILSISGFHVGIIAFFIVQTALLTATRFESLILGFNLRRSVLLSSLPAMLLYLFLTGAAPAMTRSVIMLAAFILALYAERESDPVNALLLSALLLVAVNPPTLFDISFQLSFLALWGIVILVPPVMMYFSALRRGWLRTLIQFVTTSCAAAFATAIPVLFVFNQTSLNGIVSNLLIVPLLGYGAVLAGFCALPFIYLFTPAAHLLLWLAGQMVILSNWLIIGFARMPLLRFHGITSLDMLLFLATMAAVTFARGRRRITLCILLPSLAVMHHYSAAPTTDGHLHITMLSVGQGESLLLRLPDGLTMLVDGGGYLHENGRDFGERILAPALFKLGVRHIDRMVMTHSHPDHIGGLPYVAGVLPVGEFWEAAPGGKGKQYDRLRATLAKVPVAVRLLAAGDDIEVSAGVRMTVLSPHRSMFHRADQAFDEMDMNENSLVFRLSYGTTSMLFTADAGFLSEEMMVKTGADMTAAVLKVGHHGSGFSTSETFLDRVAPKLALISAGRGNSFGLPALRTLDLLESRGIRTYRTDRDGTIELVSNGKSWNSSTPYRVE